MKTYSGGCHCGAVRYEAKMELKEAISCNCSHCLKKGLLLVFIPAERFTLLSGEDHLTLYQFNKKYIDHLFCRTCGVQSFARGKGKNGPMVSVNIRCLDDADLSAVTLVPYDGKSR